MDVVKISILSVNEFKPANKIENYKFNRENSTSSANLLVHTHGSTTIYFKESNNAIYDSEFKFVCYIASKNNVVFLVNDNSIIAVDEKSTNVLITGTHISTVQNLKFYSTGKSKFSLALQVDNQFCYGDKVYKILTHLTHIYKDRDYIYYNLFNEPCEHMNLLIIVNIADMSLADLLNIPESYSKIGYEKSIEIFVDSSVYKK
jgi:hypothetical protein